MSEVTPASQEQLRSLFRYGDMMLRANGIHHRIPTQEYLFSEHNGLFINAGHYEFRTLASELLSAEKTLFPDKQIIESGLIFPSILEGVPEEICEILIGYEPRQYRRNESFDSAAAWHETTMGMSEGMLSLGITRPIDYDAYAMHYITEINLDGVRPNEAADLHAETTFSQDVHELFPGFIDRPNFALQEYGAFWRLLDLMPHVMNIADE